MESRMLGSTHRLRVEGENGRISTAADAAVAFDVVAEFLPSCVLFRVWPLTLTFCTVNTVMFQHAYHSLQTSHSFLTLVSNSSSTLNTLFTTKKQYTYLNVLQ